MPPRSSGLAAPASCCELSSWCTSKTPWHVSAKYRAWKSLELAGVPAPAHPPTNLPCPAVATLVFSLWQADPPHTPTHPPHLPTHTLPTLWCPAVATLLFSLWQDVDFDWGRGQDQQWPVILAMTRECAFCTLSWISYNDTASASARVYALLSGCKASHDTTIPLPPSSQRRPAAAAGAFCTILSEMQACPGGPIAWHDHPAARSTAYGRARRALPDRLYEA